MLTEEFYTPGAKVRLASGVVVDTSQGRVGRPMRFVADDTHPDGRRAEEIEGGHMTPAVVVRVTGTARARQLVVRWGPEDGPWAVLLPEQLEGVEEAPPPPPTAERMAVAEAYDEETRSLAERAHDEIATIVERVQALERAADLAAEAREKGARRAEGPEGFVTRREVGDLVAAVIASWQKGP